MAAVQDDLSATELRISLLSRCLLRLGSAGEVSSDSIRHLLIADVDFLMLQLLRISFGDRIEAVVSCSSPQCREKIDIDFNISGIEAEGHKLETNTCKFFLAREGAVEGRTISCRFLNLGDLAWIAAQAETEDSTSIQDTPMSRSKKLLSRCILQVAGEGGNLDDWFDSLDERTLAAIERQLEERLPRMELELEIVCPTCQSPFASRFDPLEFLLQRLKQGLDQFYREVHTLAFWYHWSEADILSLSRAKRWRYLEMLTEEIGNLRKMDKI